jgi:cysteinyl-tRNA synthetase
MISRQSLYHTSASCLECETNCAG